MKSRHSKSAILATILAVMPAAGFAQLYKNPDAPVAERVADLMSRMTLDEKIWQISQAGFGNNRNINNIGEKLKHIPPQIGSLIYTDDDVTLRNAMQRKAVEESRLGIPILFGYDVIHGYRTVYPISLAQACSWNTDLAREASQVAAGEAEAGGIDWTFSPMIDVARDPRWGRVAEGYGEDPYTNSRFAVETVRGYQGDDLAKPGNIAACLKHYIGYGVSTAGRDYSCTDISHQALWDTYMPPYRAGVDAGAATVMSSFNDVSGVPSTASHFLLTDVLRDRLGFGGFVVSDWNAVEQLIAQGVAADRADAAAKALNAGVDMDMGDNTYAENLAALVESGRVSVATIDRSLARILELKFRLGLFENPYTEELPAHKTMLLPQSKDIARRLAAESMVLLKNNNRILPLAPQTRIALIGPMADEKTHLLGSWSGHGRSEDVTSVFEGMKARFGDNIEYSMGCGFDGDDTSLFGDALAAAKKADVLVVCLGEKREWSGENASRASIELPRIQKKLLKELYAIGKPLVLVLTNGRPLVLTEEEPLCAAILEMWQPGVEGGSALAAILSGEINPSGKLAMTFPRHVGQIPVFYCERPRARHDQGMYQDIPVEPLYGFTHGLSYTEFSYGDITVVKNGNGTYTASIPVSNTGACDGLETVHWFVSDPVSSVSRPVKELRFFEKKPLAKGETV
ncbi:MAG: glycoside hydrolase family 3 C-terminal domain-containing protein, partial [Muribaculaceae bacterium]|nr:glycoside hydrolase family 3 C-terminal domain-containing protein [Muribaculaceae bacterium]